MADDDKTRKKAARKAAKKAAKKTAKKAAKKRAAGKPASAAGKILVVVESPAKAKTINRYLGSGFVVRASMGHVRDLPKKDIGVDVDDDFRPTYEPLAGRKKVLTELKRYAQSAGDIFLATDLDREGEAIAWHLAESLAVSPERIRRVVFNEITSSAIRQAFDEPRSIDMDKVNAQQARRILDRIVGYQISPLLWRKVAPGLSAGRVQSVAVRLIVEREKEIDAFIPEEYWRIGSIFHTDATVARRLAGQWRDFLATKDDKGNPPTREAKQAFLAEQGAFEAELASFNGQRYKPENSEQALAVADAIGLTILNVNTTDDPEGKGPAACVIDVECEVNPQGPQFTVADLKQRDSQSRPPAPFTTATLQQAAASQLRFGASRTMRIAQQLYEGIDIPGEGTTGLITYMRTDSRHLSNEAISHVRDLIGNDFGDSYLPEKPNLYSSGERAQEAHEAVRPTNAARRPEDLRDSLTPEQFRLYELIWKRFVACQMTPARWKVTEAQLVARSDAGEAIFKAMGRQLEFDGFMRVAGLPRTKDQLLPALTDGQAVWPADLSPAQHFTQPPPRFTEAGLVKALEAEGIGRPSTYASIIQTIQDRQYVELESNAFHPTHLGTVVTDKLVQHFPDIFDVRFTAHMEDQLDRVEEAHLDWVAVLNEFYGPFSKDLEKAGEEMVHVHAEAEPSDYVCEKCGKPMAYRFSKTGRYLSCTGYPDCKQTHPVDKDGKKVERKDVDVACPTCGKSPMVLRRSRFGIFLGCSDYPNCKGTHPCDADGNPLKMVKPEDIHEICEACGGTMQVKFKGRRAFLGCANYPQCKNTAKLPEGIAVQPPPKPEPKDAGVPCNKCGKPMLIRHGPRGEFLACSGFPKCRNAMDLSKLDELKALAAKGPAAGEEGEEGAAPKAKKTAKKSAKKKTAKKKTAKGKTASSDDE
ncbi:MAG: type I DNA topoisomerase [Planctomycetota bacterium]|jgi:DNA topoisomerase-1